MDFGKKIAIGVIVICVISWMLCVVGIERNLRQQLHQNREGHAKEYINKLDKLQPKFKVGQIIKSIITGESGQILELNKIIADMDGKPRCQYNVRFSSDISKTVWMEEIELVEE